MAKNMPHTKVLAKVA